MPRELESCPVDMLKPTSNAALRSLSACNCSCNLETFRKKISQVLFKYEYRYYHHISIQDLQRLRCTSEIHIEGISVLEEYFTQFLVRVQST